MFKPAYQKYGEKKKREIRLIKKEHDDNKNKSHNKKFKKGGKKYSRASAKGLYSKKKQTGNVHQSSYKKSRYYKRKIEKKDKVRVFDFLPFGKKRQVNSNKSAQSKSVSKKGKKYSVSKSGSLYGGVKKGKYRRPDSQKLYQQKKKKRNRSQNGQTVRQTRNGKNYSVSKSTSLYGKRKAGTGNAGSNKSRYSNRGKKRISLTSITSGKSKNKGNQSRVRKSGKKSYSVSRSVSLYGKRSGVSHNSGANKSRYIKRGKKRIKLSAIHSGRSKNKGGQTVVRRSGKKSYSVSSSVNLYGRRQAVWHNSGSNKSRYSKRSSGKQKMRRSYGREGRKKGGQSTVRLKGKKRYSVSSSGSRYGKTTRKASGMSSRRRYNNKSVFSPLSKILNTKGKKKNKKVSVKRHKGKVYSIQGSTNRYKPSDSQNRRKRTLKGQGKKTYAKSHNSKKLHRTSIKRYNASSHRTRRMGRDFSKLNKSLTKRRTKHNFNRKNKTEKRKPQMGLFGTKLWGRGN